jgi:monovalent cation/hydrogen antiporter
VGDIQIFIAALLVSVALLNALANWWQVPYPIVLVLGGLVLGLLPGMPEIELEPDLVLLIFLPPLLYSGAFFADLNALRHDTRVISLLSIGLVLATALVVGAVAHFAFDLPWAVSIALGAVVAPTDPVAATTILRRLGIPRRIVNVLEGESLVNDASALVIYKVVVVAAIGGSFSIAEAGLRFLLAAGGGLAIGLLVGYLIAAIRRRTSSRPTRSAPRACSPPSPAASTSAGGRRNSSPRRPGCSRPRSGRSSSSSSTRPSSSSSACSCR